MDQDHEQLNRRVELKYAAQIAKKCFNSELRQQFNLQVFFLSFENNDEAGRVAWHTIESHHGQNITLERMNDVVVTIIQKYGPTFRELRDIFDTDNMNVTVLREFMESLADQNFAGCSRNLKRSLKPEQSENKRSKDMSTAPTDDELNEDGNIISALTKSSDLTKYEKSSEQFGLLLVFNMENYEVKMPHRNHFRNSSFERQMCRKGTNSLSNQLANTFGTTGIILIQDEFIVCDATKEEVLKKVSDFKAKCEQFKPGFCIIVIMTHGENINNSSTGQTDYKLCCKTVEIDKHMEIIDNDLLLLFGQELLNEFSDDNFPFMKNKNKIFLTQFCRGRKNHILKRVLVKQDVSASQDLYKCSSYSNLLVSFATIHDRTALRGPFLREFMKEISPISSTNKHYSFVDMLHIICKNLKTQTFAVNGCKDDVACVTSYLNIGFPHDFFLCQPSVRKDKIVEELKISGEQHALLISIYENEDAHQENNSDYIRDLSTGLNKCGFVVETKSTRSCDVNELNGLLNEFKKRILKTGNELQSIVVAIIAIGENSYFQEHSKELYQINKIMVEQFKNERSTKLNTIAKIPKVFFLPAVEKNITTRKSSVSFVYYPHFKQIYCQLPILRGQKTHPCLKLQQLINIMEDQEECLEQQVGIQYAHRIAEKCFLTDMGKSAFSLQMFFLSFGNNDEPEADHIAFQKIKSRHGPTVTLEQINEVVETIIQNYRPTFKKFKDVFDSNMKIVALSDLIKHFAEENLSSSSSTKRNKTIYKNINHELSFSNVFPHVLTFVGRGDKLKHINDALNTACNETSTGIVLISGFGGMGKSELARKYAKEFATDYSILVWIDATRKDSLEQSFRQLATELVDDMKENEDLRSIVKKLYQQKFLRYSTLIIFDNAIEYNGENGILQFLPHSQVISTVSHQPHVLVTTTMSQLIDNVDIRVELEGLDEADSLQLVTASCGQTDVSDAKKFCLELGYMPLALQQALAYIKERRKDGNIFQGSIYSINEYLMEFNECKSKDLLDFQCPKSSSDYYQTLRVTWLLSFNRIWTNSEYPLLLLSMMEIIGYLNSQNISNEIIYKILISNADSSEELNQRKFLQSMRTLKDYSFVISQGVNSIRIHSIIQKLFVAGAEEKKWLQIAFDCLISQFPENSAVGLWKSDNYLHTLSIWNHIEKEDDTTDEQQFNKIFKWGNILFLMGKYPDATRARRKCFKYCDTLGEENPLGLRLRVNLATAFTQHGKYEEARAIYEKYFPIQKRVLGDEHHETLKTQLNYATCLSYMGKYEESLELSREVVLIQKRMFDAEHPEHIDIISMHIVAYTLNCKGEYVDAQQMLEELVEIQKRRLGETHSTTLATQTNLAFSLARQDKYSESFKINERVYELQKDVLGPDHPHTLTTNNNMAVDLIEQEKYEEALEMLASVREKRDRVLGREHPDSLVTVSKIAECYFRQKKYDEALELFGKVLKDQKRVLGENHPFVHRTANKMLDVTLRKESETKFLRVLQEQ